MSSSRLPHGRCRSAFASPNRGERGFTLAALLVLLTVLMVFVAYTVPTHWSGIMQRERERQTIYAMQQYARAIHEFQRKHGAYPVSIDALKEARLPRLIRSPKGEYIDPLTGEVDWLIVPATAAGQSVVPGGSKLGIGSGTSDNPSGPTGSTGTTSTDTTGSQGKPAAQGIPIKDYAGGPFIGVRPPKTGQSMVEFRGAKSYEEWSYTSVDLEAEIKQREQVSSNTFGR